MSFGKGGGLDVDGLGVIMCLRLLAAFLVRRFDLHGLDALRGASVALVEDEAADQERCGGDLGEEAFEAAHLRLSSSDCTDCISSRIAESRKSAELAV